jgi:N-acetyl sugar amidotransferase
MSLVRDARSAMRELLTYVITRGMKLCQRCVLDETVPEISFDERGVCNFCHLHDALAAAFPQGTVGSDYLRRVCDEAKLVGRGKNYDLVVGVSGGTDSCYLLHVLKDMGLRPLAVNLDNGWHSDIAVSNIHKVIEALKIDLQTYVVDYEEMKDILLSMMKAGLPWIDGPTDLAIVATLYQTAADEGLKHVFVGNNFRTEGRQPTPWTHLDGRQLNYVQKKFGTHPMKTFPNLTISKLLKFTALQRIKMIKPLYHLEFNKQEAMQMLQEKYGWKYYGGHHHESVFTRFAIAYWQFKKFGIDKRKITLSAQVRSGHVERAAALEALAQPPYDPTRMEEDKDYVAKKLGISQQTFTELFNAPNRSFRDYPSYYPFFERTKGLQKIVLTKLFPTKPMMLFDLKNYDNAPKPAADSLT